MNPCEKTRPILWEIGGFVHSPLDGQEGTSPSYPQAKVSLWEKGRKLPLTQRDLPTQRAKHNRSPTKGKYWSTRWAKYWSTRWAKLAVEWRNTRFPPLYVNLPRGQTRIYPMGKTRICPMGETLAHPLGKASPVFGGLNLGFRGKRRTRFFYPSGFTYPVRRT